MMMKAAITMILAVAVGVMLTGCDKTGPEEGKIDHNTIERLSRSADNIEYTQTEGMEWYLKDPRRGNKWQAAKLFRLDWSLSSPR